MLPTVTDVGGVPLTVGARLVVLPPPVSPPVLPPPVPGAVREAAIANAGNVAVPVLLRTVMRMFDQVPSVFGMPSSRPVYTENCAQPGRLTMEYRNAVVDFAS